MFGAPHLLEIVEGADFRPEDVDDHIAGIDQHPVAGAQALDADVAAAGFLQVVEQPVGDRRDVAVRTAGGDDHVVGEGRFAGDVDRDEVLGLGVVETGRGPPSRRPPLQVHGGRSQDEENAERVSSLRSAVVSVWIPSPSRAEPVPRARLKDMRMHGDAFKTRRVAAARSAVEEMSTCGEGRKTQAGGGLPARPAASLGSWRTRAQGAGGGRGRARSAIPGRLNTAIGIVDGDRSPVPPAVESGEIVGAHHPDAGRRRAGAAAGVRGCRRCRACRARPRCRSP